MFGWGPDEVSFAIRLHSIIDSKLMREKVPHKSRICGQLALELGPSAVHNFCNA